MNSKEIKYADLTAGQYYHIYNRAIGNERLFFKSDNYSYFLRKYYFYLGEHLTTYAYCLMPNHFHILVKINDDETHEVVSNQFRKLFLAYVTAINLQRKRKGGIFIKPFKRKLILDNQHLAVIVNYIHSNPVHHNLCSHPSMHAWNSYDQVVRNMNKKIFPNILSPFPLDKNVLETSFFKENVLHEIE